MTSFVDPEEGQGQPFDDRHNTPVNPFNFPTAEEVDSRHVRPERGKTQQYLGPMFEVPPPVMPHVSGVGLHFIGDNGTAYTDLGRITPNVVEPVTELDLRVILAHLDSAAHAIQLELGRR